MKTLVAAAFLALLGTTAIVFAQDITDVEPKPYGSYGGGGIDTVDLKTGNLHIHIPLVSYKQAGKLPPLSFSVELNNAPYSEYGTATDSINGTYNVITRYDTSPPGSPAFAQGPGGSYSQPLPSASWLVNDSIGTYPATFAVMGAYITSSYEGGIVTGSVIPGCTGDCPGAEIIFSVIDAGGTTHELAADANAFTGSAAVYRAADGSGYTYVPTPNSQCQVWNFVTCQADMQIPQPGIVYTPEGITFSSTSTHHSFTNTVGGQPYDVGAWVSQTVIQDPMGNTITRGPWFWTDLEANSDNEYIANMQSVSATPQFIDSIGRVIPDILTMQQELPYPWSATSPGQQIVWNPPGVNTQTSPYTITYARIAQTGTQTLPGNVFDPAYFAAAAGWAITKIQLPNGTSWNFDYNGMDLTKITTPTGGSISYQYQTLEIGTADRNYSYLLCNGTCHAILSRTESDGTHSWTTTYSFKGFDTMTGCTSGGMQTTETDQLGNATVHTFCSLGSTQYAGPANTWYEIQTDTYQGSATSGILLKTVGTPATDYTFNKDPYHAGITNALPGSSTTTLHGYANGSPSNLSVTKQMQYAGASGHFLFQAGRIGCARQIVNGPVSCGVSNLNYNVDYNSPTTTTVSSSSAGIMRNQSTIYQWMQSANYYNKNLLTLPYQSTTFVEGPVTSSDPRASQTTYGYDEAGSPQGVYGNQTSVTRWLNRSPTPIVTSATYNSCVRNYYSSLVCGTPSSITDGNGNVTQITYDSVTEMFPHKITHPVTNGVSHVDQYIYNATIGRVSSHTDENNNVTNYSFDDVGRITDIAYPIGEVKTCYTDESTNCPVSTPNSVVTTTIASPSPNVVAVKTYDGLGRKIQDVATSDPSGATKVDTTYDEYGRAIMVSTPYRSPALATDPPTGNTQTVYDALGRVIEQIQPDQSTVFACYDGLQVLFNSQNQAIQPNCQSAFQLGFGTSTWADTTDESGHHTQRVTDGLGRLSYVVESNPGGNSLSLLTQYTYDSLDNLVSVNQYGSAGLGNVATQRSRLFSYDSLSRLIYSQNPEAGQISYSYDSNSNLYQKTDARNITITYGYDALNRVVSKTYSNGEPAISYVFDNTASGANGSGRLYQEFTGTAGSPISSRTINNYDALGRITSETKCVLISQCSTSAHLYNLGFQYDQAGRLTSYGSGYGNLTFNQQYDASGRLLSVNSVQGSTTTPLFSTPVYTPAGAIATTLLGSGLNLSRIYDQRQRLLTESDTETPQVPSTTGLPSTISILGTEQAR